jgi:Ca2+-dependent lipid-binding protein
MMSNDHSSRLPPIRMIINVMSASQLPKPGGAQKGEIIDPYVEIFVTGPDSNENHDVKTRTVVDNGFNPVWNQIFTFDIRQPDLTMITFHVLDEDVLSHDFIAFTALPVTCFRTGFRSVRLYDIHGKAEQDFEFASLFLRVTIEQLPDNHFSHPHHQSISSSSAAAIVTDTN